MVNQICSRLAGGLSALAVLAVSGTAMASASFSGNGGNGLSLTAVNSGGTSTYTLPYPTAVSSGWTFEVFAGVPSWHYTDASSHVLSNGAKINSLDLRFVADPQILWNFNVSAGASDTTFTVTSAVMNFTTMAGVSGFVTTGVTITDSSSPANGVSYTGLEGGGNGYRANYNGGIPGGSVFTLLQPSFSGTTTATQSGTGAGARFPSPSGNAPVVGTVSNMQAEFNFKLTADDQFGTTNNYKLTPAPGTMLLALGGLMIPSRRRR